MLRRLTPVEPQSQSHSLTLTTFQKLLRSLPIRGALPGAFCPRGDQSFLPPQGWAWSRALFPVPGALTSAAPPRFQVHFAPQQSGSRAVSRAEPAEPGVRGTRNHRGASFLSAARLHRRPRSPSPETIACSRELSPGQGTKCYGTKDSEEVLW